MKSNVEPEKTGKRKRLPLREGESRLRLPVGVIQVRFCG
jgi:hypothetical protein